MKENGKQISQTLNADQRPFFWFLVQCCKSLNTENKII